MNNQTTQKIEVTSKGKAGISLILGIISLGIFPTSIFFLYKIGYGFYGYFGEALYGFIFWIGYL
jgi:hypothetical protein